jgi:hypothetical protein
VPGLRRGTVLSHRSAEHDHGGVLAPLG